MTVECPTCEGEGYLEYVKDQGSPGLGLHWTSHRREECPTCEGEGTVDSEQDE